MGTRIVRLPDIGEGLKEPLPAYDGTAKPPEYAQ